ncbi:MAG: M20/M25/M40 family metallo-hydrolase [Proteobacteria bacterium]|nr:M20/M25/M40 family metallo-hydrolase [Pseudomonadota bacterium]
MQVDALATLALTKELIAFRSLSGAERDVVEYLSAEMRGWGWNPTLLPVAPGRENLWVTFGTPKIILTTHLDVVPAPEHLFTPVVEGEKLIGRGACDAKGLVATMVAAAHNLLARGERDFGLLFVVGEEEDGSGARAAAEQLSSAGIQFIINGEPTEGLIAKAHKGAVGFTLQFTGTSCHSGYPELGKDANREALEVGARLAAINFGYSDTLGAATINIGKFDGGVSANVVSPEATLHGLIRTVTPNAPVCEILRQNCGSGELSVVYDVPCTRLIEVPGIPSTVVSYCCDIEFLKPLRAQAVLYGPGSIIRAHTDSEYITRSEIADAIKGYEKIYFHLKSQLR